MVSSIASTGVSGNLVPGSAESAVALRDTLARCKQQLGGWAACPSGKTPEGKRIMDSLQSRISNIETRLQRNGNQASPNVAAAVSSNAGNPSLPRNTSTLGSLLNTFA